MLESEIIADTDSTPRHESLLPGGMTRGPLQGAGHSSHCEKNTVTCRSHCFWLEQAGLDSSPCLAMKILWESQSLILDSNEQGLSVTTQS